MQKSNVQQIIRELFIENFNLYSESYPSKFDADGNIDNETASENAEEWATQMWNERSVLDIERDDAAGVDIRDYNDFAQQVLSEMQNLDA